MSFSGRSFLLSGLIFDRPSTNDAATVIHSLSLTRKEKFPNVDYVLCSFMN